MAEVVEPGVLKHNTPKRKLKVRASDLITFGIITVVIVILALTLMSKLQLKHNVTSARAVSDKVIADIAKRDGAAVRALGSAEFQRAYSSNTLTQGFNAIKVVTPGHAVVDRQIVDHGKNTVVYIVYKYPPHLAKQPYFIRVAVTNLNGKWLLTNVAGSASESSLLVQ
ncbi:MAG TPA: hypothetical protein VLF69_03940 [Candidatus Saccharimonadales bacterium]|nr:hypothetical protein [Candidatus Saccharimonadales bacterium]